MTDSSSSHVRETDPTLLRLKLIGQMEAKTLTGESVLPVGGKTRALLAVLALSDRKPVLRSRLAELLWSQRPEEMARASLRQEIHRLLDALSPLGVDVIDVQRHSLTLKPALTSVDAERLLTASSRTIDGITVLEEPLLGELAGVDPALDDWLFQQRERLCVHLRNVYENAVLELTDPDQVDEVAERLLKFDNLNETAWRAKIQTALHRGDHTRAAGLAEQLTQLFNTFDGHSMAPATQSLIAGISMEQGGTEAHRDFPGASTSSAGDASLGFAGRPDPMLALPLHYTTMEGSAAEPRRIALVFLPPLCADETLMDHGQAVRDHLELIFVHMGTFDILAAPVVPLPDPVQASAVCRGMGADYIISGMLRRSPDHANNRLILRVLDARRHGVIVWGTHYDFPGAGPETAESSLLTPAQAMQWNLFVAEARRITGRPDAELSALGMGLRAFMLLLRHDVSFFERVGGLLEGAFNLDADDGAIALIDALYCYIWYLNDWSEDADAILERGLKKVRDAISLLPDLHAVEVLLATYLMHDPARHTTALSVARAAEAGILKNDRNHRDSPDYLLVRIVLDLLEGNPRSAAKTVRVLTENTCRSQFLELLRPVFMMVLLIGDDYQEVIAMGRLFCGIFPACPSVLVYYLVALVELGDFPEEAARVRRHLMRLAPDLTVAKIMSRFSFVSQSRRETLADALQKAGLPVS
ncbi:AfsR/SARP family transcriptional regulator [Gluconobacter kanchanaburiensis]|nr:hypothetical protein [Gluconobacter kanchanaburiensis]MBF0861336.1 hypothetical protein [Gluconobacter kanchanaburiensis]